jgi:7,8-dihydroneopterin aldolase/epimerase/oxygenase
MPTKRSSAARSRSQPGLEASIATGKLILSGLSAFGYHGNNPAERRLGQNFSADIEVMLDTQRAAASDHIVDTLSYPVVERIARQILEGKPANLLETVAERIATAILEQPRVVQVTVRVTKRPPLPNLAAFTVEVTRPVEISKLPQ